jgi:hypothetical protein
MLEHHDKRPMLENVKTPQNGYSGTDIKSDLTTNNSQKIKIWYCYVWNIAGRWITKSHRTFSTFQQLSAHPNTVNGFLDLGRCPRWATCRIQAHVPHILTSPVPTHLHGSLQLVHAKWDQKVITKSLAEFSIKLQGWYLIKLRYTSVCTKDGR